MQEVFEMIFERLETLKNRNPFITTKNDKSLEASASRQTLDYAKQIVKEVAEEYNNGWIPCSERLPDETAHYLVTTDNHMKAMYAYWKHYEKRWFYFYSNVEMFDVIAWQPLPEPYQQKG